RKRQRSPRTVVLSSSGNPFSQFPIPTRSHGPRRTRDRPRGGLDEQRPSSSPACEAVGRPYHRPRSTVIVLVTPRARGLVGASDASQTPASTDGGRSLPRLKGVACARPRIIRNAAVAR